ncbi:Thioredoxin domain-containing protein [Tenacibaculum sp. 190524A05c]|uniref:TlpA family protein disulfide reductase n=1 Tax=Tenacibaculum platacis TaxID=3137852 RepID=UPI0031FB420E
MRVFIVIIVCVFLSCKNEKRENVAKTDTVTTKLKNSNKGFATIIITNESKGNPVSIFRTKNYYNANQNLDRILSKKANDTISFLINRKEKIGITTKNHIKQETILKPDDIVEISIDDNNLSINSNCKPPKIQSSLELKTLRKSFYEIDSSRPFKPHSTKYEKKAVVYPLNINYSNFKNKEDDLFTFIDLLIKETNERKSSFSKNTTVNNCNDQHSEELDLSLVKELGLLYSYSKNEKLERIITDYYSELKLDDINLYEKTNIFIKRVILKNEKIKEKFKLKVDYGKAFDLSSNYTILKPEIQEYLKLVCINQMMAQKDNKASVLATINKFEKQYPNSFLAPQIQNHKSQLQGNTDMHSKEVLLVNHNNIKTTLDKFLKNNLGKVVYIDLWASWCLPCRYKMEDLKKLKEHYADKNVAFVYLSIDEYEKDWKQASIEEELNTNKNSFLIQNFKSSKFLKSLKINSIPRYLLLGRNGEMIDENAPGPDAKELKELINKNLL